MSRKLGCEKKPAFDHFSRDLGVNPFLPLRWVVRDEPSCPRPDVPRWGERSGRVGTASRGGPRSVFSKCHMGLRQTLPVNPLNTEDGVKEAFLVLHSLEKQPGLHWQEAAAAASVSSASWPLVQPPGPSLGQGVCSASQAGSPVSLNLAELLTQAASTSSLLPGVAPRLGLLLTGSNPA